LPTPGFAEPIRQGGADFDATIQWPSIPDGLVPRSTSLKLATVLFLLALLGCIFISRPSFSADSVPTVNYPEGYRQWAHIKSTLISPAHKDFSGMGGFQHIYANPEGMTGYRTRAFPEGSTVVFDWLEMQDRGGVFVEGSRRQLDVMVKDSRRFSGTGGWGFQRFVKDSKSELADSPSPRQCFACHEKLKQDGLILSRYRQ
jgi:cytochrome P460